MNRKQRLESKTCSTQQLDLNIWQGTKELDWYIWWVVDEGMRCNWGWKRRAGRSRLLQNREVETGVLMGGAVKWIRKELALHMCYIPECAVFFLIQAKVVLNEEPFWRRKSRLLDRNRAVRSGCLERAVIPITNGRSVELKDKYVVWKKWAETGDRGRKQRGRQRIKELLTRGSKDQTVTSKPLVHLFNFFLFEFYTFFNQ